MTPRKHEGHETKGCRVGLTRILGAGGSLTTKTPRHEGDEEAMQTAECKYQNAEWRGEELTADFADDADSPETNHGWTRIGISPHLQGAKS